MAERRQFALLIDSDNISARYIDAIITEITANYGDFTYKRIYGDWTSQQNGSWKNVLLTYSLKPVQQFRNTVGKNATDSTLIIDAMDILYSSGVDGFCIVSSDSDFTSLAQRLGEAGKIVIGMGEQKTPASFRNACTQFITLDNLLDDVAEAPMGDEAEGEAADAGGKTLSRQTIQSTIIDIIRGDEARGVESNLADLGNRLISRYPDFDVRAFGYSQLSKFLKSFGVFELTPPDAPLTIALTRSNDDDAAVRDFVHDEVRKTGDDGCDMAYLGIAIRKRFPLFDLKEIGYSKLSQFLRDIPGIEARRDEDGHNKLFERDA